MVAETKTTAGTPSLVWVYPTSLSERLDSATWIETTRELRNLGWQVDLLSKGASPGRQTIRGVETISLGSRETYLLGQLLFHLQVIRYIWSHWRDIDVVLFTQVSGFWLFPMRFLRLFTHGQGPLMVMDTRDLFDPVVGSMRIRIRKMFHSLVFWLADHLADGQTAITSRMAELVKIPPHQLWGTWPSGVDIPVFLSSVQKRRWPSAGEPVRLIYIGMLLEKRHLDLLCQALIDANGAGAHLLLTLVGEGSLRHRLEEYARESDNRIHVRQPVAHEEIPDLLAEHHIGVTSLPDPGDVKYEASSPIKLFEYLAAGMPILATTNVCHTDVVGDGCYAFWAESAAIHSLKGAMLEIANRSSELPKLGGEALAGAQNWTWAAAAKKLSDALLRGLAGRRQSLETLYR